MRITLEFENVGDFFSQLPRFAALMNFSGQFANITKKPKADSEVKLEEPDLPVIERPEPGVTRIHGTKTESAEEAGKKIEAAYDAAEANEVAAGPAKPGESTPAKARSGAKKKADKSPEPEEAAPETPQASAEAKDATPKDVDVRKALNALIKAGKRDAVKAILNDFGASNFSTLKAADYGAVIKKAKEALGDG